MIELIYIVQLILDFNQQWLFIALLNKKWVFPKSTNLFSSNSALTKAANWIRFKSFENSTVQKCYLQLVAVNDNVIIQYRRSNLSSHKPRFIDNFLKYCRLLSLFDTLLSFKESS
jgi:hypothetical protein